jgi:hypothetical protein
MNVKTKERIVSLIQENEREIQQLGVKRQGCLVRLRRVSSAATAMLISW